MRVFVIIFPYHQLGCSRGDFSKENDDHEVVKVDIDVSNDGVVKNN